MLRENELGTYHVKSNQSKTYKHLLYVVDCEQVNEIDHIDM